MGAGEAMAFTLNCLQDNDINVLDSVIGVMLQKQEKSQNDNRIVISLACNKTSTKSLKAVPCRVG